MHVEDVFGDRIQTAAYFLQDDERDIAELIDAVIQDGYEIIFTANQKFLAASLKAAIEHPEVKILNCSVGQPHNSIRTYYGRLFEAKYLAGMIAGAMTENEKIAYRANFPIYGTMAEINAFALGARMTNPRAQIYLHWDSLKDHEHLSDLLDREDISVVSGNDMIRPGQEGSAYGLFIRKDGKTVNLAAPIWNWGRFYERIISDILQGSWGQRRRCEVQKCCQLLVGDIKRNHRSCPFRQSSAGGTAVCRCDAEPDCGGGLAAESLCGEAFPAGWPCNRD
jgi:basic membrane lipoprotein Med (substrate-binding protein (PBP1-ABC) superfamily)